MGGEGGEVELGFGGVARHELRFGGGGAGEGVGAFDSHHVVGWWGGDGAFEWCGFVGGTAGWFEDGFSVVGGVGIWWWGWGGSRGGSAVDAAPEGVDVDCGGFGAAWGLLFVVSIGALASLLYAVHLAHCSSEEHMASRTCRHSSGS